MRLFGPIFLSSALAATYPDMDPVAYANVDLDLINEMADMPIDVYSLPKNFVHSQAAVPVEQEQVVDKRRGSDWDAFMRVRLSPLAAPYALITMNDVQGGLTDSLLASIIRIHSFRYMPIKVVEVMKIVVSTGYANAQFLAKFLLQKFPECHPSLGPVTVWLNHCLFLFGGAVSNHCDGSVDGVNFEMPMAVWIQALNTETLRTFLHTR